MVFSKTYSKIFETLGVLTSFSLTNVIWNEYEKFAVSKLNEATMQLRGVSYYLKDVTPKSAQKELKVLTPLMPVLANLKNTIETIDDKAFRDFQTATLDFYEVVEFLYNNLENIADVHSSYKMAIPAFANDWDSSDDQRWDNYENL